MKGLILGLVVSVIAFSASAQSDHYVSGYVRQDGTYVAPHYQTNPNGTRNDNYSTRGNVNPYTGEPGTKPRDGETTDSRPYGSYVPYYAPPQGSSYGQMPTDSSYPTPAPYPN